MKDDSKINWRKYFSYILRKKLQIMTKMIDEKCFSLFLASCACATI